MSEEPQEPRSGFNADRIDPAQLDRLVSVLDIQAGMPGVQRLRAWERTALGVRPGERALDVGSGTGSEVLALAEAVGDSGDAVGLEPNPGMRELAQRRATEAGSTARFVDGNAYALPFDDDSLDVVRCERVFQYLLQPHKAAAEIGRVLKPGGRVALLDSDWGTAILHPGNQEVVRAMQAVSVASMANPYSGRMIAGQLAEAGLVVDDVGSQALLQARDTVNWPLIQMMTTVSLVQGAITEEQRERFHAELEDAATRGALHMSVTMFAVVAHKL